ncbi:MAG TPA: kelch repeat-containing protein [Polyangia bacterium]
MRPAPLALAPALALAACTVSGPQQCPSLARPTARSEVAAVLVPATNQIYALGGQGPNIPSNQLWRYSFGACGGWTELMPASNPGPRANYAAAFDDMRNRIIYIGGAAINDVWALSTDDITFTKLAAVGSPPVDAASEMAVYDDMHDRVIYAGIETYELDFGDSDQGSWMFIDGNSLQVPASGVYDPTRSTLFARDLVGVHGFSLFTSTWHDVAESGDLPTSGAELVWYDQNSEPLAVADGVWIGALDALGNDIVWNALPTTNAPPARTSFAVAVSGTVLWLSGGVRADGCTFDDLWTLDLETGTWTNVWPATTCS